jgi:two-component system, OmpR family, response regulator VicR
MEQAKSLKVLCVEDEPEMIDLIRLILGQHHVQVIGAIGGRQGIEALSREKPDLVLLDIMMPEVDGWEVFRNLKAEESLKDTPVIVVTAKAQSIDKVLGLYIAKVDDYVTKPFGPQELLQSVQRVLEKRGKTLPPK